MSDMQCDRYGVVKCVYRKIINSVYGYFICLLNFDFICCILYILKLNIHQVLQAAVNCAWKYVQGILQSAALLSKYVQVSSSFTVKKDC